MAIEPTGARAGKHALIIEDELLTGLDMQGLLSELGFGSFAFASTAFQALDQARRRRPDLVTVDVGLLDGTGVEAARAITQACGPVPTLFVTGDPAALDGEPGAVVVGKPFSAGDLTAAYHRLTNVEAPAADVEIDG